MTKYECIAWHNLTLGIAVIIALLATKSLWAFAGFLFLMSDSKDEKGAQQEEQSAEEEPHGTKNS